MAQIADENSRLRLDNATLEARAAAYPETLREPFVWLGCHVREDCSRDLDVLVERAKKVGITIDKTNWSKVLRGRWDTDARGEKVAHPCVALEKLLKAIDALRKDARIKEMSGRIPFVETSTTRMIFDFIDVKRTPDRVCKMGIVIGETGTQKTAAFKEYKRQNNHGACEWMDCGENASMYKFKTQLAALYGCHPSTGLPKKEHAIINAVNDRKTIIFENIQRLYLDKLEGNQPVFNYIQWLQEVTGSTIILSFTPTFERTFTAGLNKGFFEQFVGRAGGTRKFLRLEAYPPEEDVLAIANAFKLRDADKHLEYLVTITREPGRIRRLFEDLQDAKIDAEAEAKPLTITHVKSARDED